MDTVDKFFYFVYAIFMIFGLAFFVSGWFICSAIFIFYAIVAMLVNNSLKKAQRF